MTKSSQITQTHFTLVSNTNIFFKYHFKWCFVTGKLNYCMCSFITSRFLSIKFTNIIKYDLVLLPYLLFIILKF